MTGTVHVPEQAHAIVTDNAPPFFPFLSGVFKVVNPATATKWYLDSMHAHGEVRPALHDARFAGAADAFLAYRRAVGRAAAGDAFTLKGFKVTMARYMQAKAEEAVLGGAESSQDAAPPRTGDQKKTKKKKKQKKKSKKKGRKKNKDEL